MNSSLAAAKQSCVPQEQNELVADFKQIQTGLIFRIPKLKIESLQGRCVYLIGDTEAIESFGKDFSDERRKHDNPSWFFKVKESVPESYMNHSITVCRRTILDIPQEHRRKGIVVCFDEPSYNGRQCLFHLFGGDISGLSQSECSKIHVKPYQAFSELIDKTQDENTDAIVFVPEALQSDALKPVMWHPKKVVETKKVVKPARFPKAEVVELYFNIRVNGCTSARPKVGGYPVDVLSNSIKSWVKSHYPETVYVVFGPDYTLYGLNKIPPSYGSIPFIWETTFQVLPDEPKFPKADVKAVYLKEEKYVVVPTDPNGFVYPVENLSESMKLWVQTHYPKTAYVQMGPSHASKNGMMFVMWGWNEMPKKYNTETADWRTQFESVNDAPAAAAAPLAAPADPVATQLAALTEAVAALTKLIGEKLK